MDIRLKILRLYIHNLTAEFTINEISKGFPHSYSYIYQQIQRLQKERIIKVKRKGKATLCSPNLQNPIVLGYLSLISKNMWEEFKVSSMTISKVLEELLNRLKEKTEGNLHSLILFGSYTKGQVTPSSDIDILIIVPKKDTCDEIIQRECNSLEMRYNKEINPIIIEPRMLTEMMKNPETVNVGKEATANGIAFYGAEKFWDLILRELSEVF